MELTAQQGGLIFMSLALTLGFVIWLINKRKAMMQRRKLLNGATSELSYKYISEAINDQISYLNKHWEEMAIDTRESKQEKFIDLILAWKTVCNHEKIKIAKLIKQNNKEDHVSYLEDRKNELIKIINFLVDVHKTYSKHELLYRENFDDTIKQKAQGLSKKLSVLDSFLIISH